MIWMSEVSERRKPFLVCIEDADEHHFRQIDTLSQEIHSHKTSNFPRAEAVKDLYALDSLNIAVEILGLDLLLLEEFGKVLGHLLGQRRGNDAAALRNSLLRLVDEVVDLAL
jgi:hypothetical protein